MMFTALTNTTTKTKKTFSFLSCRGLRVASRRRSSSPLTSQSLLLPNTASPHHHHNNNSKSNHLLNTQRYQSTESQQPQPLFLWLGDQNQTTNRTAAQNNCCWTRLLLPVTIPPLPLTLVDSAETALQLVNQHYETPTDSFVGGMGESDPGVWFASVAVHDNDDDHDDTFHDPLEYADLVAECIELVQTERHGVPFGLYTTGILKSSSSPSVPLTHLGLDCLHVSLFAGTPKDYVAAVQRHCGGRGGCSSSSSSSSIHSNSNSVSDKDFGTVCGFIADAAEQGLPVEVGLAQDYATGAARNLALSLGAQNVHVY